MEKAKSVSDHLTEQRKKTCAEQIVGFRTQLKEKFH